MQRTASSEQREASSELVPLAVWVETNRKRAWTAQQASDPNILMCGCIYIYIYIDIKASGSTRKQKGGVRNIIHAHIISTHPSIHPSNIQKTHSRRGGVGGANVCPWHRAHHGFMLIYVDLCWYLCWFMLIHGDLAWFMLIYVEQIWYLCWFMLIYVDIYVDLCWFMLI